MVRRSAASCGREFILEDPDSWMIRDPLGPNLCVAALSGPRPVDATFCMRCVRTWRSAPSGGQPLCEYPQRRPTQVKCAWCSASRHLCQPVRVLFPILYGDRLLTFYRFRPSMTARCFWSGVCSKRPVPCTTHMTFGVGSRRLPGLHGLCSGWSVRFSALWRVLMARVRSLVVLPFPGCDVCFGVCAFVPCFQFSGG